MSLPVSDLALPSISAGLRVLEAIIGKAEVHASERNIKASALLESRLAADMFCFADQIQAATDTARRGLQRLSGAETTSKEDPEPSFAALVTRVRETLEEVQGTDVDRLNGVLETEFDVSYGPEMTVRYTGKSYLLSFLVPNFFFHVTTAYNILRERGVALGKMDFLGPLGTEYKVQVPG